MEGAAAVELGRTAYHLSGSGSRQYELLLLPLPHKGCIYSRKYHIPPAL